MLLIQQHTHKGSEEEEHCKLANMDVKEKHHLKYS